MGLFDCCQTHHIAASCVLVLIVLLLIVSSCAAQCGLGSPSTSRWCSFSRASSHKDTSEGQSKPLICQRPSNSPLFFGIPPKGKRSVQRELIPAVSKSRPIFQNYIPQDRNIMHKVGTRFEIPWYMIHTSP